MRTVPGLGLPDFGHDAADPRRRRQAVRRLRRRHSVGDHRPADRQDPAGADLRRVPGASNFTYAEASWPQALADWIGAHTRSFEAIGGVPNLLVPDNTKVAVIKACLSCIVEVFLEGERIAAHVCSSGNHHHTTVSDHMPSSHRRYADWTVERIRHAAAAIGPATTALCELILERRPHPEQGFCSCLGLVRLVRPFGADRLEAAATRAIEIGTLTYGSVRSILDNKLDRQAAHRPTADAVPVLHPNIRGPRYYH